MSVNKRLVTFSIAVIIFCFLSLTTTAQEHSFNSSVRVLYNLNYQSDSTNKESASKEYMALFLNNTSSFFESYNQFLLDSCKQAQGKSLSLATMLMYPSAFKFYIWKDRSQQIQILDFIHLNPFSYTENKSDFKWELKQDTATVNNIACQKAECDFGNRHWIAWFAPSIPVSDGPYKFCGLPGLIVKVADSKDYYDFTMIGYETLNSQVYFAYPAGDKMVTKITKQEFFKGLNNYDANKMEVMKNGSMGGAKVFFKNKQDEKKFSRNMKNENNPIELY